MWAGGVFVALGACCTVRQCLGEEIQLVSRTYSRDEDDCIMIRQWLMSYE